MNMKKYIVVIICCCFSIGLNSQDLRYSQVLANPLRLNAAVLGANTDVRATMIYRNQWAAINRGYTSTGFSVVAPVFVNYGKGKVDFGISILKEKADAFLKTDFLASMGYTIQLAANSHLSVAMQGGYVQNILNSPNFTFDSQYVLGSYNAANPTNENMLQNKNNYADVGFGLMWFANPPRKDSKINAYIGISGFHLNQPNISFTNGKAKLPAKYGVQMGLKIMNDKAIDISPNARVFMQNGSVETAAGLYLDCCLGDNIKIVGGLWCRKKDAYVLLVGIEHKSFSLAYSYDAAINPVSTYFPGVNTNEISIGYKLSRLARYKSESFGSANGTPSLKNNLFNAF